MHGFGVRAEDPLGLTVKCVFVFTFLQGSPLDFIRFSNLGSFITHQRLERAALVSWRILCFLPRDFIGRSRPLHRSLPPRAKSVCSSLDLFSPVLFVLLASTLLPFPTYLFKNLPSNCSILSQHVADSALAALADCSLLPPLVQTDRDPGRFLSCG